MNSPPKKVSVVYFDKWIIAEIGAMVCETLGRLGYDALPADPYKPADPDADVLLLLGDCLRFEHFLKNYNRDIKKQRVILWQVDPLPPPCMFARIKRSGLWFVRYYEFAMSRSKRLKSVLRKGLNFPTGSLDGFGAVDPEDYCQAVRRYFWLKANIPAGVLNDIFVSTVPKQKSLESMGISSRFVSFGNHPFFGGKVPDIERDIDVIFFGHVKLRRKKLLAWLERELRERHINFVNTRGVTGKERELLLNRSKLSLILLNQPWDFPGMRFQLYMSCGSAVISERLADTDPYIPGVHYASSELADLPDTIEFYLKNTKKKNDLVSAADELISRHTLEASLLKIIEAF